MGAAMSPVKTSPILVMSVRLSVRLSRKEAAPPIVGEAR